MQTRPVTFAPYLAALTVMAGLAGFGADPSPAEKRLSWQENSGVPWQTPWAAVRLDQNAEQRGPVLRFLKDELEVHLEKPVVEKSGAAQLTLRYQVAMPGGGDLTVVRRLRVERWDKGRALVETFELRPGEPVVQDLEIVRPFSIRTRELDDSRHEPGRRSEKNGLLSPALSSLGGEGEDSTGSAVRGSDGQIPPLGNSRPGPSCTLPLKNGWAKPFTLTAQAARAEYRLGHWIGGRDTPELALPVVQLDQSEQWQAAVCADPRFSSLFSVTRSSSSVSGEVRYRYAGSKVPVSDVETRTFAFWLRAAPAPQEPFGKSLDAFFRLVLPEVPPGPRWLHEIYMVGYDFLSDNGLGWEQDIARLASWLKPGERRHVALCLHGWYDALGSYSFDEASGRLKPQWVAMERTRHVPFTPDELRRRLRFARQQGFRVLLYFGDGLATDSGVPGYHDDWAFRDGKGNKTAGWQGPDTFGKTYLMNPAHPELRRRFLRYLEALLAEVGRDADGFVWDETFHARAGQIASEPAPAYCDRAMLDLVKELTARVKRFDAQKVFLASDCVGIGPGIPGYAIVADGLYQDTHCAPERWPDALFPNWRNTYWSCNWGPSTHFQWTRFGVEEFGAPVAISNGWEEDHGPHEWTAAEREAYLQLFRQRLAKGPAHVRYLTEDPAKILKERRPTDPKQSKS